MSKVVVLRCEEYDIEKVRQEANDVLRKTEAITKNIEIQQPLWIEDEKAVYLADVENEYLLDWYAPEALSELLLYRHFIDIGDYQYKDLLRVILTRSARSARLTTHFDLDFPKSSRNKRALNSSASNNPLSITHMEF